MNEPDAHYTDPRLAAIYDAGNGWSEDRQFYLELAGTSPIRVLDLGCGTGLLCDAYAARGHSVTGADPASRMLEVASRKPHGARIEWVRSTAQAFSSAKRFDLIIMTGHAFQVLLGEDDVRAAFRAMRAHLAPGGRIAFESRNPAIDWSAQWNETTHLDLPQGRITIERVVTERTADRIRFDTFYKFDRDTLLSRSELRFWTPQEIDRLLSESGLRRAELFGDWKNGRFDPKTSEEIIVVARADA